jgi:two-component system chemotaxis sensor kinase CheA
MNDDLKARLLKAFEGEGRERIQVLTSDILALAKGPEETETQVLVESAFRETHSLKGAARAVGLSDVERFCQAMESVFSVLKKTGRAPSAEAREYLVSWVDLLSDLLLQPSGDGSGKDGRISLALSKMRELSTSARLFDDGHSNDEISLSSKNNYNEESGEKSASPETEPDGHINSTEKNFEPLKPENPAEEKLHKNTAPVPSLGETVRVDASLLTNLLLQTEELLFSRNALESRSQVLFDISERFEQLSRSLREFSLEREVGKKQITDENFKRFKMSMKSLSEELQRVSYNSRKGHWELSSRVDGLISEFKTSMLLPFSSLLDIFPKMVRDICRESEKKVDFKITGQNVRIDRRILERLKDPFIHLIRNAIDHGIESSDERLASKKPETGKVSIEISRLDRDVIRIIIRDDGGGVNLDVLKSSSIAKGVISKDAADLMDRRELINLIFLSGMSTKKIISDISGRGLGMAIVRDRIETLGGNVFVSSITGKGMRVVINLPVTLTSFRGLVVESAGQSFVIPKNVVRRVVLVRNEDVELSGGRETIIYGSRTIPIVSLADILELKNDSEERRSFPALILGKGRMLVAVTVDSLAAEQDIMSKPFGSKIKRVRNVSGVSMLGSGTLAPILHVPDILKTAMGLHSGVGTISVSHVKQVQEMRTVLVAEDSITSRVLLKNVLEAAGYNVVTAVDGQDALAKVKSAEPDVLVSDVEMPNLDGFGLTEKVRKIDRFANLPVILVTSLGSKEDREKGVDAGANAYIVKSNFDQSNLLDVIARFC